MADETRSRYDDFAEDVPLTIDKADEAEPTLLERLVAQFGDKVLDTSTRLGENTAIVEPSALTEVMTWLRHEERFVLLSDLTAHDCHGTEPRFWVIYQLTNMETPARLRIKVGVPEKKPEVESVVSIWPGANFLEREVFDLFGITFKNHPNLKRIMMPPEWEGHPLRKDYPIVFEPIEFSHNYREIHKRKPFAKE